MALIEKIIDYVFGDKLVKLIVITGGGAIDGMAQRAD